jgi:hypothetical protein
MEQRIKQFIGAEISPQKDVARYSAGRQPVRYTCLLCPTFRIDVAEGPVSATLSTFIDQIAIAAPLDRSMRDAAISTHAASREQ